MFRIVGSAIDDLPRIDDLPGKLRLRFLPL